MRVVLISASRNPDGQTSRALKALLEGIRAAGGQAEQILLPKLRIERCRHCEHEELGTCQREGRCAVEDDFASVVEKIRRADAAVFATPVYFGGSGQSLRALLHRLQKICTHPQGRRDITGTPAAGVCIGGGAGNAADGLKAVLAACGFDVVEMVTAPRGGLHLKLDSLKGAGRRLAGTRPTSRSA